MRKQVLSMDKAAGAPSTQDYRETKRILCDFGLSKMVVPEFETREQLVRWRKTAIDAHLSKVS